MNTKLFLLSILSVAALAACGGGGGGDAAPAAAAQPAAATGPAAPTTAASKYAGTWKSACFKNTSDVRTNPFDATTLAYQTRSYTFVATGASSASVVWTDTYYLDTDTSCALPVEFEVIRPNTNTATIDGTTTTIASGAVASQTVDQVTLVAARPFTGTPIPTGTYRLYNPMWFPSSYDQAATIKQIALVTATTLTFGGPGLRVNGYPTQLDTTANLIYTKQP